MKHVHASVGLFVTIHEAGNKRMTTRPQASNFSLGAVIAMIMQNPQIISFQIEETSLLLEKSSKDSQRFEEKKTKKHGLNRSRMLAALTNPP